VTEALARGESLEPANPADRAAVEAHFGSIAGGFAELPPEDRATAEDLYVQQTGVLPAVLRDTLFGGMLSDDPGVQAAAQRLAKLEDTDSALVADIPEEGRMRTRTVTGADGTGRTG
jgi:hypothetical protein